MLRRSEQRFGNGDGVYTVAEMMATVRAYNALVDGPQWLRDSQRELRLGIEIAF